MWNRIIKPISQIVRKASEWVTGIQSYPSSPLPFSSCVTKMFAFIRLFIRTQMNVFVESGANKSWMTVRNGEGLFLPCVGGWRTWLQQSIPTPVSLQCDQALSQKPTQEVLHGSVPWNPSAFLGGSAGGQPHSGYLANDKLQGALLAGHINAANQLQNRMGTGQWRQEQEIILGNLIGREGEATIT